MSGKPCFPSFSFHFIFFPKSERRVKICVCFQEVDRRTSSFIYGHQTLATIKDGMLIINVLQYTLNGKIALLRRKGRISRGQQCKLNMTPCTERNIQRNYSNKCGQLQSRIFFSRSDLLSQKCNYPTNKLDTTWYQIVRTTQINTCQSLLYSSWYQHVAFKQESNSMGSRVRIPHWTQKVHQILLGSNLGPLALHKSTKV